MGFLKSVLYKHISVVISFTLYYSTVSYLHEFHIYSVNVCSKWSEAFDTCLSQVNHVEEEWRGRLEKQDQQETGS